MGGFIRLCGSLALLSLTLPVFAQEQAPSNQTSSSAVIDRVPPPPDNASAPELEQQGDQLRSQKYYLDSIDYYRAAMAKKETAVLHNKIGISLLLLRREGEAKKEFQKSIHLDKSYAEAYNNLGALMYNLRRYGSAVKQYKKAIKLSDDNASFHSNLGQASGGVSVKLVNSSDLGHFHYVMAQMYGQHGNVQRCRYYLAKANEEGYPIKDALHDSVFAGLRKDPNFVAFVRSLKAPSPDGSE
jgi:tetratricopeptide (TPR) repeat protein